MGDATSGPVRLSFNPQLRVEFRGATVTSDAGLFTPRELDERLGLPVSIQSWSLTSLQQQRFKTSGRLIRHARHFVLPPAEGYLTESLFRRILHRIERRA